MAKVLEVCKLSKAFSGSVSQDNCASVICGVAKNNMVNTLDGTAYINSIVTSFTESLSIRTNTFLCNFSTAFMVVVKILDCVKPARKSTEASGTFLWGKSHTVTTMLSGTMCQLYSSTERIFWVLYSCMLHAYNCTRAVDKISDTVLAAVRMYSAISPFTFHSWYHTVKRGHEGGHPFQSYHE